MLVSKCVNTGKRLNLTHPCISPTLFHKIYLQRTFRATELFSQKCKEPCSGLNSQNQKSVLKVLGTDRVQTKTCHDGE